MPKNLPALRKIIPARKFIYGLVILVLLAVPDAFGEEPLDVVHEDVVLEDDVHEDIVREDAVRIDIAPARWYRSNSSGMIMEYVPSRLVALRGEYSLSIEAIHPGRAEEILPALLLPYYEDTFSIELRTLYENGRESRRQWIFLDNNITRLTASGSGGLFGFIEIRNFQGQIEREFRFEDDLSEWEFCFIYEGDFLLNVDTFFKETDSSEFLLLTRDTFFYSRSGSVRAVERTIHEEAEMNLSRQVFPRLGADLSPAGGNVSYGTAYTSPILQNVINPDGTRISYTVDSRGRILTEVWYNEDDEVTGEFINTWSVDRLLSVLWTSPDDERLVEYEYDSDGNRVMENNFRRGVLERRVTFSGSREVEDLFMNGIVILRAVWEDGVKISEERMPLTGGPR